MSLDAGGGTGSLDEADQEMFNYMFETFVERNVVHFN